MVSQHARPARLQVRGRRNSANRTSNELLAFKPDPIYSLLLYIWKDMDCEGDECEDFNPKVKLEIKSAEKKEEKKVTETMHLMTVSCGRPNYQVHFNLVHHFGACLMLTINIGNQRHQKATRSKFDNDQIGGIVRPSTTTHTRFHRGRYGTPI